MREYGKILFSKDIIRKTIPIYIYLISKQC